LSADPNCPLPPRLPVVLEPSRETPAAGPRDARTSPASSLRILVVDDNQDSAVTLGMLLRTTGHDICTAHDGLEAVGAASEFRPDVVVLEIGLPKMNGYDAARAIRQ
jgi:PleD family two-component response regulator